MKVLHLATAVEMGGAAAAMRNLHRALREQGVDSRVLGSSGESSPAEDVEVRPEWRSPGLSIVEDFGIHQNRTALSNTYFSADLWGAAIADDPAVREADVLHLHWVAGFLSTRSLRALAELGKPVCWTLHDMRPFTGGCHFSAGCEGFVSGCDPCPQLREDPFHVPLDTQTAMRETVTSLRPVFVAPSRWLAEEARRSVIAEGREVAQIPYGVDLETFRPGEKAAVRRRLGLDPDTRLVLLGAQSFGEQRKGFSLAEEVLRILGDDPRVRAGKWQVVCVGNEAPAEVGGWPVTALGYLPREAMAEVYAAVDVLLFTSLEDNLPNVVLEAMASGVPVVAFAVGGLPDLVVPEVNGALVSLSDPAGAAQALSRVLENPVLATAWGNGARARAESDFSLAGQAAAYRRLYDQLRERPALEPERSPSRREAGESFGGMALVRLHREYEILCGEHHKHTAHIERQREKILKFKEAIASLREAAQSRDAELKARQQRIVCLREELAAMKAADRAVRETLWFKLGQRLGWVPRARQSKNAGGAPS